MTDRLGHSMQTTELVQGKNSATLTRPETQVLLFMLIAFSALCVLFRNPFVGQWDSFDYVTKAVQHEVSDLAFGRPLFMGILMAGWELFHQSSGLQPQNALVLTQAIVMGFGILGLVSFYFCAKLLASPRLALFAVAWLATTPMYMAYSGMVMTEVPSLTFLTAAVAFLLRWQMTRRRLHLVASALLFAGSVHLREQLLTAALVFPLLIVSDAELKAKEKWYAIFFYGWVATLAIVAVIAIVWWADPEYPKRIGLWWGIMKLRHQETIRQFYYLVKFTFVNSALAFLVTLITVRGWFRNLRVRAVGLGMGVFPLLAIIPNADLWLQPRYELVAVPAFILTALVGLQSDCESKPVSVKKRVWAGVLLANLWVLSAGLLLLQRFNGVSLERKIRVEELLATAPHDAVFIGGAYTPVLEFYRQAGIRPRWQVIRSGWEWKGTELPRRLTSELEQHHVIYYLNDEHAWDYLRSEENDVLALRGQFEFIRASPGMERIEKKQGTN